MKIACVTTTINTPTVLALYAKHGPDVTFFVIGDRKTDDMAVVNFLTEHVPNHLYYGIDVQHSMYPKLSHLIGENCIQRRNIGFLEALKWGADIIVSIDDDNIPTGNYFGNFATLLQKRSPNITEITGIEKPSLEMQIAFLDAVPTKTDFMFNGIAATSPTGWFDVGQLLSPKAEHRGFPYTKRAQPAFESITDARIGVAAGICMGDPDIGAVERIANGPTVHGVSELLRSGIVTDPCKTWTVFNSQNTAFIRELTPAMFMLPHCGRYDDIFASLITQHVMREQGLHVHFGHPFVWQQRNAHDLVKDLTMELMGMQTITPLADYLNMTDVIDSRENTIEQLRAIYYDLGAAAYWPKAASEAALAWCDEIEKVM